MYLMPHCDGINIGRINKMDNDHLQQYYHMKSHFGSTLSPAHSSEICFRYKIPSGPLQLRSHAHKPAIFTQQIVFSNDGVREVPTRTNPIAISLEKLTFEKLKEHRQMLANARLPSFHIKRLIDKSTKKRREDKSNETGEKASSSPKKPLITQNQLKKYWQKYLQEQKMSLPRPFSRLSPDSLSPVMDKQKKSKLGHSNHIFQDHYSCKKQILFVNNFVRTSYRRFKEGKFQVDPQLSLRERRDALRSRQSNEMAPWEREAEIGEDQCFGLL